jgi:hypothetical protein
MMVALYRKHVAFKIATIKYFVEDVLMLSVRVLKKEIMVHFMVERYK